MLFHVNTSLSFFSLLPPKDVRPRDNYGSGTGPLPSTHENCGLVYYVSEQKPGEGTLY